MTTVTIHISDSTLSHILCYFTGILFIFYIVLIAYNSYKYWQNRNNIILQKRYCKITMYTAILMIPKIIFNIFMYATLLEIDETKPEYTILIAIDDLLGIIFYYLWVWRFWLIFYDTKWIISVLNRRWQNLINPKHLRSKKDNWYLMNRLKYGKSGWMFCHIIFPIILISTILIAAPPITLSYLNGYNNNEYIWNFVHLISSSVYYVPFILLAVILCKLPSFNDEFFIISELKRIFFTFCIDNSCHLAVFLIPTIIEHNGSLQNSMDNGYVADKILFPGIGFNIINLSQTVAVLISTRWVMNKVYIVNNIYDVRKANIKIQKKNGFSDIDTVEHSLSVSVQVLKLHHTQSSLAQELINKHTFNYGDDLGITLIDILTNEQSFDIFVKHLSLEFSLECLLSLIEFIQFQQMIDEYINDLQLKISELRKKSMDLRSDLSSSTSSTTTTTTRTNSKNTDNSIPFIMTGGTINSDRGGIISNFTNQIFSSNKSNLNKPNIDLFDSRDQSLINNIPDIIDDDEYKDWLKRRFLYRRIQFPRNVPKSKIVYDRVKQNEGGSIDDYNNNDNNNNNNNDDDGNGGSRSYKYDGYWAEDMDNDEFLRLCKLKAFTLYRKYVVSDAGLEINVGWSIKKKLLNVMGNNNKIVLDISLVEQWDISLYGLIKLFDQCCNQMLLLMKDSFDRFKITKQFDKLKKGLFSSNQQRAGDIL